MFCWIDWALTVLLYSNLLLIVDDLSISLAYLDPTLSLPHSGSSSRYLVAMSKVYPNTNQTAVYLQWL